MRCASLPEPIRRLAVVLLLGFWLSAAGSPSSVSAQPHLAGLIIDYGNGSVTYAVVPFDADTISGIELLRESRLSLVSIPFGGLGEGVCSIEGHGCGVGDCRRLCQTSSPNSPFWHYYVLDDEGWGVQTRGASGTDVSPGAIHGWSWTGDEPQLPELTFDELTERSGFEHGADEPAARTLDAAGTLVTAESNDAPWLAYGATAVMLAILTLAMLFTARRRGSSRRSS